MAKSQSGSQKSITITKPGWRRIEPGRYRYNGADGRALAYVRRCRDRWSASVSPVPCSIVDLPNDFRTMREAKAAADRKRSDA